MKDFWDSRYKDEVYAYGETPNDYLKDKINDLNLSGSILLPCEGEGRNAVYCALKGLKVQSFDLSSEGKSKAIKLAQDNNVEINYSVGEFETHHLGTNAFDVVSLIYAHFPVNVREKYHHKLIECLKPSGVMIIEGFSKSNIDMIKSNPNVGGPKNIEMLYSIDMIQNDFAELEIIELTEEIVKLNEGVYHNGEGAVVRFVGRKKS